MAGRKAPSRKHRERSEVRTLGSETELQPRPDETLGQYIRRIRVMRGLNLPDVARVTSQLPKVERVSHPYLSQIELGHVFQPARARLPSIARVLGIPGAMLLEKAGYSAGGTGVPPRLERNPMVEQIAMRAAQLDPADQKLLLCMMEAVLRMRRGESKSGIR
jgi:transcriptional regulator with XRE-family HTH domain